jgi:hypothetical protein
MNKIMPRFLALVSVFLFTAFAVSAQVSDSKKKRALKVTEKVAEFTLKTTAKVAVATGKFIGNNVVVPFVKNIAWPAAKAAPPLAAKGIKLTAKGVTKGIKAIEKDHDDENANSESSN